MRRGFTVLVVAVGSMLIQGCPGDYSGQMQKSMQDNFGRDLKAYTFRSTPVGNFGVGTIYGADLRKQETPEDKWLLSSVSSWFREDLSEQEKKAELAKIIEGGDFGTVQITKEISHRLTLDAVIPNIRSLLDIGAGVDLTRGVNVTLSATRATNRKLNWGNFVDALNRGLLKQQTKEYVARDDIAMGAADIILEGYSVQVRVEAKADANLKAGLSQLVGKVAGNDAELKVQVQRQENGTFRISSERPVVAAVLYLQPPQGHAVRSRDRQADITFTKNFTEWSQRVLPRKLMKTIEEDRAKAQINNR